MPSLKVARETFPTLGKFRWVVFKDHEGHVWDLTERYAISKQGVIVSFIKRGWKIGDLVEIPKIVGSIGDAGNPRVRLTYDTVSCAFHIAPIVAQVWGKRKRVKWELQYRVDGNPGNIDVANLSQEGFRGYCPNGFTSWKDRMNGGPRRRK